MKRLTAALFFLSLSLTHAVNRYVDSAATGANNGTSWANAWTSLTSVTANAGDTVFISGGPAGSTKTYNLGSTWNPPNGSAGNPITYKIGQETGHNGTANFQGNGVFMFGDSNTIVSGDAGDGAMHFQTTGFDEAGVLNNSTNLRVSYVNFGNIGSGWTFNPGGPGIEIDHCYIFITSPTSDRVSYGSFNGNTWDLNTFHHNTVFIPRRTDGVGSDGLQWNGGGFSIYNNTITGYGMNYTGGQHQDGWQALGGDFIKLYNNKFVDIGNYPIFGDAYFGDFSNLYIYNNLVILVDPVLRAAAPPQGIAVGPDGGAQAQLGFWPDIATVKIFNNVVDGYVNHSPISLWNPPPTNSAFIQCEVRNNVFINSGGPQLNNAVAATNNISFTNAQAAANFVSFTVNSSTNDYRPKPGSSLIGAGNNMSAYATADADGAARPASGNWDIGAYQASTGPDLSPPALLSDTIPTAGNQLTLVFDKSVQAGAGGNSGWTLNITPPAGLSFRSGIGSNTLIYDITGRAINAGESATLSYAQPGNGIESTASATDLLPIANRPVTNNSTQGTTATPVITLPAGPYFGPQTTTITTSDTPAGAVLRYTVDGSTPTATSTLYSAPISIASNQTIKAISIWSGHPNSAVASSSYEVVSWVSTGPTFKTFLVPPQTGTFTWKFSVLAPAAGSDCVVGIGPSPVGAYAGMACIVQFLGNTINAFDGGTGLYTTGPAYTAGTLYNFVATINMTAHTWTVTVVPATGGTTATIVTNVAFRSGHTSDSQLSSIGIEATSGVTTTSAMSFPAGASSARYIGLRGVPASGAAVP